MRARALLSAVMALLMLSPAAAATMLTEDGFLPDAVVPPYTYVGSREAGAWEYMDRSLHITIERHHDAENAIVWFETIVRCKGSTRFVSYMTAGDAPGNALVSPKTFAQEAGAVLAINDDYFGIRRMNSGLEGIILRNGQILSDRTKKGDNKDFPPLEVMALFLDGRMKTYASDAHTAEEYLEMGVTDTYAFGPILVQNGALGERMTDESYSPYREPRCAIGMIKPNHYVILTVLGRTDESKGVRLRWLADRMLALGAVEALNLDGGATTALYIMGDLISHGEVVTRQDVRGVNSLIGIGRMPEDADAPGPP